MSYTHTTFGQLQAEVSNRLDDPTNIFWSQAEVQAYILEALRTWQAFSHFWRDRKTFNTLPNTIFYDLTQQTGTKYVVAGFMPAFSSVLVPSAGMKPATTY